MSGIRFCLTAIVAVAIVSGSAAIAQTSRSTPEIKTTPLAPASESSNHSTVTQVENWTKKQWEAAKKEWATDKTKWTDCQKQSGKQKLEGRKSWSFLYNCMTG
jgi:Ni/Co efflux regulator RcnB